MIENIFVIGNGESRLPIDLKYLRESGKIYGCNALYRDFTPDVLVSVDDRMTREIIDSKYKEKHYHRILKEKRNSSNVYDLVDNNGKKIGVTGGLSSGALATSLAADLEWCKNIYLIGFDFYKTESVNNVYKDTNNYLKSTDRPVDPNSFRIQMNKVIKDHQFRNFIWVNDYYRKVFDFPNFHLMYIKDFKEKFKA